MGKTLSRLSRPLKNWNIESRAHKAISKSKPKAAPTYDTTYKQIEMVDKIHPTYKETANQKDSQLDDFLKKVFVSSNNTEVREIDSRSNPDRPLPKDKLLQEQFEFGFYEPDLKTVPQGKITLRQGIELISKHSKEKEKYTVEVLAAEYKLEPKLVANILEHFKLFEVIDNERFHNNEVVAKSMPISQRSGIRISASGPKKELEWVNKVDEDLPKKGPQMGEVPSEEELKKIKEK